MELLADGGQCNVSRVSDPVGRGDDSQNMSQVGFLVNVLLLSFSFYAKGGGMGNDRLREAQALSNGLPGLWPWLKAGHQKTVKRVDGTVDGTFH